MVIKLILSIIHTYNSLGIVLKETEEDEIKDFVLERLENLDNNMDKFKNTPEQQEFGKFLNST